MTSSHDILTSPRVIELRRKKRRTKISRIVLAVVFFMVLIIGLSYLSQYRKITISQIEVAGNHIISQDEIKKVVDQDLSGKYLHLFARNNFLIYPKKIIHRDLIASFPRLDKLTISLENLKTIKINLSEHSGAFLWCGDKIPENQEQIGENCFFVNNDGYIFDKAPYFSGNLYFKFYLPVDSSSSSALGKQMMPKDDFIALVKFIDAVNVLDLKPVSFVLNSDGTKEIYLAHSEGATVPKIIFNKKNDLEKIANNLSLAIKKPEFADEIKNKYNTLLYIDLRFDNKVLYKFE